MSVGDLVRTVAVNLHEHGAQYRENFHVAVVVDRSLTVGFQMIRVNHVHIRSGRGGSLVSQIDGMAEGQVQMGKVSYLA